MKNIAIVGLGYVGLPLSLQFARGGCQVLGLDIDPAKIEAINAGRSYIKHIEAAAIDGAGSVKRLFFVTLPYIKSTIVSTVLLRTIWIMNFPEIIYAMTSGGPNNATNILSTQMINKLVNFCMAVIAAISGFGH